MQYHAYIDAYDAWQPPKVEAVYHTEPSGRIRKIPSGKNAKPGWREWYNNTLAMMRDMLSQGGAGKSEFNLGVTEYVWRTLGRPYYNVHPRMLPVLGSLSLPDIPAKLVQFEHCPYVVQFPVGEPSLVLDDGIHCLKSAICMLPDYITELENAFQPETYVKTGEEAGNRLIIWLDFGEVYQGFMTKCYKQLEWRGEDTLQQAYDALPPDFEVGLKIPLEVAQQAVKMVIAVGFIAADPENGLVRPHVLNADVLRSLNANPEQLQHLHNKAAKAWGRLGYIVGDDMLITPQQRLGSIPSLGGIAQGRHLNWQHIVGMHWKIVRYGPNHSLARPQLILPYRRGKDLPFRPAT